MSEANSAEPPAEAGVAAATATAPRRSGGYAALVAAGILLSRLAGLIRQSVFAHYLGATGAADAFNVAMKMPNFLQNMFGEGVLSAAFIPVYSRLVSRGEQKAADRVAGVFVSFLAVLVAGIVVVGVVAAPLILSVTVPGLDPEVMRLAVKFTRIVFPGVGLLVLYAWALGILNTHRQFFIGYVAPVLWSAAMIATLLIFGMWLSGAALANALAWGTLVGCALQFGIEIPFVLKHAKYLSFGFDRSLEHVRAIFRNILPVVGGRGVVQISGYVDTFIASFLPVGAVTRLAYAQTLYMLPISVFGMSVAAAELPQMAGEKGSEEEVYAALRRRLDRAIRQVSFFVVPTMVAFIVIGNLLIAALFQRGLFTPDTTLLVWYILVGASVGLLGATLGRLYSSTFYALHDTRTPFRIALARVAGGTALALLFAFPLRPLFAEAVRALGMPIPQSAGGTASLGVVGITLASAFASWLEMLLLRHRLLDRIGQTAPKSGFFVRLFLAALAGGAAAVLFDGWAGASIAARLPLTTIVRAALASGVFGVVYFAAAFILGIPEMKATLSRFRR